MSEKIVTLNEEVIKGEIRELVRGSVEETLNNLLEAEADKLTQARRYERTRNRHGSRELFLKNEKKAVSRDQPPENVNQFSRIFRTPSPRGR